MTGMEKEKDETLKEEQAAEEAVEEKVPENGEEAEAAEKEAEDEGRDPVEEANDKYMRLAAEYQNYRRRTEQERVRIAADANERIAKDMLDVMDSFQRAFETAPAGDDKFKEGMELIFKKFVQVLANFGVEAIEAEGKEFDPNFHSAVMTGEEEGVEAGMVLMELQKGYMLRDRVLRPSMVKVSV